MLQVQAVVVEESGHGHRCGGQDAEPACGLFANHGAKAQIDGHGDSHGNNGAEELPGREAKEDTLLVLADFLGNFDFDNCSPRFQILDAVKFAVEFYSEQGYTDRQKGADDMPNIKPISDLRNYSEVLRDVSEGAPVFLTKNGRGKYAIVDMRDYEKTLATIKLMNELEKGRMSGETEGWLTLEAVEEHLGISHE